MASKVGRLKTALLEFRKTRETKGEIEKALRKQQPELIVLMQSVDPDNVGVVVDPGDRSKGAAFVQQNDPSEFWDDEEIIEWLKKPGNKRLWLSCSSRVFDPAKWEAMIASGEIPKKKAIKFKKTGESPSPFIRFGKIGEDSIE